jgi:hypothetical protein
MTNQTDHENTADKAAVTPPPALTTEGRLRARVQTLEEDAERNQGLAKVGARCMREGHQGLIESGRATVEGHRFALSVKLGLGTDATWDAIHERVKELRRDSAEAAAVSAAVAPPTNRAAPFGSPDCTCVPFTRKEGMPRACGPDDTVDDISGWETGRDCPHHAPVASPTDPTHGLSVPHADALWDAVAIPGPHTPTYPEQHERVCRVVREILDELTPARDEVADWDDLVRDADRLRRDGKALHARAKELDNQLAALRQQVTEPTDKAAVLRDFLWRLEQSAGDAAAEKFLDDNPELRRMADETATQTPDVYLTTPCDACDHTLNWHSSGETGCTVPRCACARYYHAAGARQDGAET